MKVEAKLVPIALLALAGFGQAAHALEIHWGSSVSGTQRGIGTMPASNNAACLSGQGVNTDCRVVVHKGTSINTKFYDIGVASGFADYQKQYLNAAIDTANSSMNNLSYSGGLANAQFTRTNTSPNITFAPADYGAANGATGLTGYVRVTFSGCSVATETPSDKPGIWRLCTGATIGIDANRLISFAGPVPSNPSDRMRQAVGHGINLALGLGRQNVIKSPAYTNFDLSSSVWNLANFWTAGETCLMNTRGMNKTGIFHSTIQCPE